MPLFEYQCQDCQHKFEALISGTRTPVCPDCNSVKLQKLLSVFSAHSDSASYRSGVNPDIGKACGSCGDPRGLGACNLDD